MSLNITIYWPDCVAKWAVPWLNAVEKGFTVHGLTPKRSTYQAAKKRINSQCDLAVFWSHRPYHIMEQQKKYGHDYLVMERGYVGNRMNWTSLGFNGLNNRAEFHADNMPGDRWNKYFPKMMKSWKDTGNYILLIGQLEGDESIKGRVKMSKWLQNAFIALKIRYPKDKIVFRPHPLTVSQKRTGIEIKGADKSVGPLGDDLKNAKLCVTYNSNTGVESVLAGVPTIAIDKGAMAFDMTTHNLNDNPIKPNRKQWAFNLVYKQWNLEEISRGIAWDHLKQRYN